MARRRFPRRWPLLRLTDTITALGSRRNKVADAAIFRMFGIGDALLFRAVLPKYAEALGMRMDEITVIGSTTWKAAADLFFKDIEIILIDERRFAKNFFYRLEIMRKLRRRGFRIAISGMRFRYPHVVESLMLATGAPKRIIAEARPNEKFDAMFGHYKPLMTQTIAIPENEKPRDAKGRPLPLMHEIEHELAFLSEVAGKPITLSALPSLSLPSKPVPLVNKGEHYAVINIGASHEPRRWPLVNFADIAARLTGQGMTVVVLGGPAENNLKPEMNIFKSSGTGRLIVSIGDLSFTDAALLTGNADLVVSNDTGLGHLAVMMKRPCVLLVGGGHYGCFMPYPSGLIQNNVRFLNHTMPCYHCNWNCTMQKISEEVFPCLAHITPANVWQAIHEVMPGATNV